jgi:hypothetical protein
VLWFVRYIYIMYKLYIQKHDINIETETDLTHRSAHGIRASPEQVKQSASPRRPVASPTKATGPRIKSHVILV